MNNDIIESESRDTKNPVRIAVFCVTRRGLLFVERLFSLAPGAEISVFCARETDGEPRYFEAIRRTTESLGGRFFEYKKLGDPDLLNLWQSTPPDLVLAVSWRFIIPASLYSLSVRGAYVFHDSLLPKYRGFSPTVWAMINGESQTGVSIVEMAPEVDSGLLVDQIAVSIGRNDYIYEVMESVTEAYLSLLSTNLPLLIKGRPPRAPQDQGAASYGCRRVAEDYVIDWKSPSVNIFNMVRASSFPYPGAYTNLHGNKLVIWRADILDDFRRYVGRVCGRVVEVRPGKGSVVLTVDGALLITEVGYEGENSRPAHEVLNKTSLTLGR